MFSSVLSYGRSDYYTVIASEGASADGSLEALLHFHFYCLHYR